jgi:GDPmannose 4,6-dehydratase
MELSSIQSPISLSQMNINGVAFADPKKKALVFGLTGQDASYMCELLLEKGYEVHGTMRRSSTPNTSNVNKIISSITTHLMDLSDATSVNNVIAKVKPDIMFCLAAQSDVRASYDIPLYTEDVTGLGFGRILEAARQHCPNAKIYQAGSSEMFGKVEAIPQNETTPFHPRSPYGCSKVFAFSLGRAYREGYGMKIYNGILFNHESPRRGHLFVTRKIVKAAVKIKNGKQTKLKLGNLEAKRDWGSSKNYMEIIHKMVTEFEPQDFVVATGETHTIEEFVKEVFEYIGLGDWHSYVEFDSNMTRPAEVDLLLGDMTKVRNLFGYDPITVKFKDLVKWMVDEELKQ